MMIEIKRWDTDEIIHQGEFDTIKECLEDAVSKAIDCSYVSLKGAELNYAKLNRAELNRAKLNHAKLNHVELKGAYLNRAELNHAELNHAELNLAELNHVELNGAELNHAKLNFAELNLAELNHARLNHVELNDAKLNRAELNGAELISQTEYINKHFAKTKDGYIVYKSICEDTPYAIPDYWVIKPNSVLTETVNPLRSNACGCGVNAATQKWCRKAYKKNTIWKCLIKWEWAAGIVVPYNTDGKIRCEKLQLLHKITEELGGN